MKPCRECKQPLSVHGRDGSCPVPIRIKVMEIGKFERCHSCHGLGMTQTLDRCAACGGTGWAK